MTVSQQDFMRILIDENIPLLAEALDTRQNKAFKVERFSGRTLNNDALGDCTALVVRSTTRVDADLLKKSTVRFVGTATSGSEHIDVDFLQSSGIFFRDARGCNANSVAEYVIFSMLLWAEKSGLTRSRQALRGKRLGIIGFGHIGQRLAQLASMLGLELLVSDPPLEISGFPFGRHVQIVPLKTLMQSADIVTNHVPYTLLGKFAAVGMIDSKLLNLMPQGALLIHASRGGIVVESALSDCLEERQIHAVIDVWRDEPSVPKSLASRCLLATPHIAGYSFEGKINGTIQMARELERFFASTTNHKLEINYTVLEEALTMPDPIKPSIQDHKALLEQLRISRELERDSSLLLASLESAEPEKAFDNLRKTYPKRREILLE